MKTTQQHVNISSSQPSLTQDGLVEKLERLMFYGKWKRYCGDVYSNASFKNTNFNIWNLCENS